MKRLRNVTYVRVTMRTKLIMAFSFITILFAGVSAFNLLQVDSIRQQFQYQNEQTDKQKLALQLKQQANSLASIYAAYVLTKQPELVDQYNSEREGFYRSVESLALTASNADERNWSAKLTNTSKEFTGTFDKAQQIVGNTLQPQVIDHQLKSTYKESELFKEYIFELVDHFNEAYNQYALMAVSSTDRQLNDSARFAILTPLLVMMISTVTAFLLIRSFMRPIQRLQRAVKQVAEGDLRHKINSSSQDELGKLSQSFDLMIDQIKEMLANTQTIASSLSEHSRSFQEFSGATASANKDIVRAIEEISSGSEEQARYSEDSAFIINDLTKEIREISDYTGLMQSKSREAAFNTHSGTQSMEGLKSAVEQSEEVLHQVYLTMETLSGSSAKIGRIVGTITEISTQTNVLALNAAIEAARAGVHGKGFFVIAEEVRLLSAQTNESSKSITLIVQSLLVHMREMEASLNNVKQSFDLQNGRMNESMRAFSDIRVSMDGLSGHIEQIHTLIAAAEDKNDKLVTSVQHVAAIAQETAAGVEEVNSASQQQDAAIHRIASQSDDILSLAQRLFDEINHFKISDMSGIENDGSGEKQPSSQVSDEAQNGDESRIRPLPLC
ncbi:MULTISPECIES: methyl-accepting chemotaxis protein [unclassified Paenibacillus]|uniref:methyl-accepting chemotaxis protein n=1 Tax=unclassified Paenibacillus TaxID=185978 RepID=UPI001AE9366F|nr:MULTISPECIES: methyl-accepting chemotaxis protein [unclassified Paenibacillus]MBP1154621.1 methyl-accepting chemotaxis protein [Paenibacillus sp. PvP091]MBP1169995.1 methyl-accepting chemotaxis protein [Paenibacillus sp. PvR098]MBP2441023.1 methyl-accepting chemotaxis protein [Paenibacillus sp. PvP052]